MSLPGDRAPLRNRLERCQGEYKPHDFVINIKIKKVILFPNIAVKCIYKTVYYASTYIVTPVYYPGVTNPKEQLPSISERLKWNYLRIQKNVSFSRTSYIMAEILKIDPLEKTAIYNI